MFKQLAITCGFLSAFVASAHAAGSVGFHQEILDEDGERPLPATVWYPTASTAQTIVIGENAAFKGYSVIMDGEPEAGKHPLIVLSHGFGGSWRNLSWIAHDFVARGFVVAAVDHPGTTTFDRNPEEAKRLWERPHDISRLIDALLARDDLGGQINAERITAIGHSLGGWTMTALAGGLVSAGLYAEDCRKKISPATCGVAGKLGLTDPKLERDMHDDRIKTFVSLDLGGARGFTPESLGAIEAPFLVLGAGIDTAHLPAEKESGYLASHLASKTAFYALIKDATHFSFMQICKPGAVDLIEKEDPGDGIVCKDGSVRDREAIHKDIADRIADFIAENQTVN